MAIGCSPRLVICRRADDRRSMSRCRRASLALIDGLRVESKMAILLVSHDLAVIAGHCDRIIVMYAGVIMERGPVDAVLREPRNPYTLALLEARPRPGAPRGSSAEDHSGWRRRFRKSIAKGCPFAGRCALTIDICRTIAPPEVAFGAGHGSRCHRAPAKWGWRRERSSTARGLVARQVPIARPASARLRARMRAPAHRWSELLDSERALVRHRRRIGLWQVDARAHRAGARPAGLGRGAP